MTDTAKGPAFTSASMPKPATGSQKTPIDSLPQSVKSMAQAIVEASLDTIVAAPLNSPDFVNLVPVNPGISFRWVMHTLYKQDGTQNSIRYEEAKAQGFEPARIEDIKNPPMAYAGDGGVKFVNGDLILMKISRRTYEGALLWKDQQAAKQMLAASGRNAAGEVQKQVGRSAGGKIQTYVPTQTELEAFVSADSNEGASPLGGM